MRPSELISGGKERRAARILTQPQARLRILIFDPPKLGALEEFFNISCVCAWLSKRRHTLRVKMFHAGDARPNASTAKFTHAAAADKEQGEAVMRGEWRPGGKKKARSWRTRQVSRILTVERVLSTFPANTATDSMLSLCYWPRDVLAAARPQLLQMWCTPRLVAQPLWQPFCPKYKCLYCISFYSFFFKILLYFQ